MTPIYLCLWTLLVGLLLLLRNRRAVRRWWRTRACLTPDCVGRLPAEPLHDKGEFVPEQCEICEGWVKWSNSSMFGGYIRVRTPKEHAP